MATAGAYIFRRAKAASPEGVIQDENAIQAGEWAWIDRSSEWPEEAQKQACSRWLMIYARCPDCGHLSTVWRLGAPAGHNHDLSIDGELQPSVQCDHTVGAGKCGFHTHPTRLEGFTDLRILKLG